MNAAPRAQTVGLLGQHSCGATTRDARRQNSLNGEPPLRHDATPVIRHLPAGYRLTSAWGLSCAEGTRARHLFGPKNSALLGIPEGPKGSPRPPPPQLTGLPAPTRTPARRRPPVTQRGRRPSLRSGPRALQGERRKTECPLALEAAEGLLKLGVKGVEVNSLMLEGAPSIANMEWLTSWIKAHAHIHGREYTQAVTTLRQLEERSPLRENHSLLVAMGECYYYSGDTKNALISLQRAQAQDPHMERGLDILAALLAKERRHKDLERLVAVPSGVSATEHSPEHWVAMAYLLHAAKRNSKAIYFAQKACMAHPRNVEALILKGAILMEIKKYTEAVIHFREAMQMAPHRFEPHLGLVDCYVGMHRLREALTIASNACKQLGQSPRALTLYASVLTKDPVTVVKARAVLEKALQQDERYLPAVYLLAEVLEQEMSVEAAISLLERQVAIQPTCLLHQMLGDLLARAHDEERALDHYSIALNLDPSNRRALEGLHRLDSSGGGAAGGSGGGAGGGASGTGGAGGSSGSGTGSGTGKLDGSYYMGEEEGAGGPAGSAYERLAAAAAAAAAAADAAHARVTAASAGDSENEATTGDADESETEAVWSDMDLELASHFI